jgi:hypothetical protein
MKMKKIITQLFFFKGELMQELEKKTRVPWSNMTLIYKGQKLHLSPLAALEQYGIFTGSRLLLVGEKVKSDILFNKIKNDSFN